MTENQTSSARRCAATTRRGHPCRMRSLQGSDLCWSHDPSVALDRRRASSLGGAKSRRSSCFGSKAVIEMLSPDDALALLSLAADDTLALENTTARSRVLVSLALAAVTVWEAVALEKRVQELEATAEGWAT